MNRTPSSLATVTWMHPCRPAARHGDLAGRLRPTSASGEYGNGEGASRTEQAHGCIQVVVEPAEVPVATRRLFAAPRQRGRQRSSAHAELRSWLVARMHPRRWRDADAMSRERVPYADERATRFVAGAVQSRLGSP